MEILLVLPLIFYGVQSYNYWCEFDKYPKSSGENFETRKVLEDDTNPKIIYRNLNPYKDFSNIYTFNSENVGLTIDNINEKAILGGINKNNKSSSNIITDIENIHDNSFYNKIIERESVFTDISNKTSLDETQHKLKFDVIDPYFMF